MPNGPQLSKYVVEFFHAGNNGAKPTECMYLKAENDSDAVAQANWLARRTWCRQFQVRVVTPGAHGVIYRAPAGAWAA